MNTSDGGIYYQWDVQEENGTHNFLENTGQTSYNISKVYYAVYNISIKNNGSTTLDFKLKDLRLHEGDRIFNATLDPYWLVRLSRLKALQDLEKENKIYGTTLLPGQSLNGTVIFRVKSLYNRSFLLMYNTTPITSASFEKSIDALQTAEHFNYSTLLEYTSIPQLQRVGSNDRLRTKI